MKSELKHTLFNSGDCISEQMFFSYIDNQITSKERHLVEKHLLDCALCTDALEGLETLKNRELIKVLNQKIDSTISKKHSVQHSTGKKENKIIQFNYKIAASVAASLILLIGSVFLFKQFTLNDVKNAKIVEIKQRELLNSQPEFDSLFVLKKNHLISEKKTDGEQLLLKKEYNSNETINISTKKEKLINNVSSIEDENISKNEATIPVKVSANHSIKQAIEEVEIEIDNNNNTVNKDISSIASNSTRSVMRQESKNNENTKLAKKSKQNIFDKKNDPALMERTGVEINAGVAQDLSNDGIENLHNQPSTSANTEEYIYSIVDEMPDFIGGKTALNKFIKNNFKYPFLNNDEQQKNQTIYLTAVIDKNGNIADPKILKGINQQLDQEALRVVKIMPKWKAGTQNKKPVSVRITIPFTIDN